MVRGNADARNAENVFFVSENYCSYIYVDNDVLTFS